MLKLSIPYGQEQFDESTNEFILPKTFVLRMEHSLVSLSKWESIWEIPFLDDTDKTTEQVTSYVECMILNDDYPSDILEYLTDRHFVAVNDYIGKKMTATWFTDNKKQSKAREIITSELVYYWMIAHKIHKDCENWHLNRLLTLIQVCNRKNEPPKKMNPDDQRRKFAEMNARRKAALGTKG